ncbi:MAG: HlyD family efflux transporter periplasmic adaptor subunit [Desulfuromonadaceae bacterium]|nr:HlyD family efflux transporter periplasmic adaptor subunit [Desulfuromonadaceae bacterium]MDD5106653.1 HlyD family efflux transporter periplasmic adaptor subunit [Desulfuromonadaceae bacterium]
MNLHHATYMQTSVRICAVLALLFSAACSTEPAPSNRVQGYVEADYVYVTAPLAGKLRSLSVRRGAHVSAGESLFLLESVPEKTARDEATQRLAQIRAQRADAGKGKRPTEIAAVTAQLNLARTALQLSEQELARQEKLLLANVVALQDVERQRSARDQNRQRVGQLEAELRTAQLGSRSDQMAMLHAQEQSLEAALARSEWELAQKQQSAPAAGVVFDTLYRPGEWIAAGRPVIVLLPPQNIKVRTFVPQSLLTSIHTGSKAAITVDGKPALLTGIVAYISPQAEYTPPVIYSQEHRQKLVYLVELTFDPAPADLPHPGQPVDVQFGTGR